MEGVGGVEGNKTIMEEDEESYDDLEEGLEQHEFGAVGKDIENSHSFLQHGPLHHLCRKHPHHPLLCALQHGSRCDLSPVRGCGQQVSAELMGDGEGGAVLHLCPCATYATKTISSPLIAKN